MASTNDLDRLKKSEQGIQATNDTTSEPYQRGRVVKADEVKTGLSKLNGSWASEYLVEDATATSSEAKIKTGLGQVGLGDIDFVPYGENTSRIGVKGSPTLGAPISFEILGSTLKSPHVDWTWSIDPTANTITMTHASKTINTEYGIARSASTPQVISFEDLNDDFGGLYLIISHLGNINEKWSSTFSPVGLVNSDPAKLEKDSLEIFKVKEIDSSALVLTIDDNTPLSKVFNSTGDVAGITFLRKKSSRLLEAPKSEGTTFFVMPPEKSSSLDFEPPLSNWLGATYDASALAGTTATYGSRISTPVPVAITHGTGVELLSCDIIQRGTEGAGEFSLRASDSQTQSILGKFRDKDSASLTSYDYLIGKILRIVKVDDSQASTPLTDSERNAYYGYFEIVDHDSDPNNIGSFPELTLRRVSEQNHVTGNVVWNPKYDFGIKVEFTIHRSISEILSSSNLQTVEVESARIKSLIPPNMASVGEASANAISSLQRGSSCTWDGNSLIYGNSPSNLSELGFGVVVYPAKLSTDTLSLVADYSNPLKPDLYEVDYEGATVYFKSPYTQSSSVTNHSTNPLKKTVLFISCVPLAQEASYGVRLLSSEDGMDKGAFQLPKIPQLLSYPDLGELNTIIDQVVYFDGTNSLFIPSLTVDQVAQTGVIEADTTSGGEPVVLRFFYRGASNILNGVKLDNIKVDFDPYGAGMGLYNNPTYYFSRHGNISYKQSMLAGRSARSGEMIFTDGSISYGADGSMSVSIGGLRTDESTLLYDSTSKKWVIDSEKYEVGLSITRGDLVASNVTEIPTDTLSVKPIVVLSKENSLGDYTNDGHQITVESSQFGLDKLPDLVGLYLNVEGGAIRSARANHFPDNARVVLGLDYAGTSANPWQSKFISYKNDTGSQLNDGEFQDALNASAVAQYPNDYESGTDYFYRSNSNEMMIAGRSPSVFPAYSYVETISIEDITANVTNAYGYIPPFRYLLSLEEVGGNKWVTVAIKVPEIELPNNNLSGQVIGEHIAQAQFVCDALNEDLYFGHAARLLNRAGFYEGFHQDHDNGDDTINTGLQAKIDAYTNHTVRGERQVLWVTSDDPRHPNFPVGNDTSKVTVALICTGRGCGKIPVVEGTVSPTTIKAEAIKSEYQLINVIASIGSAEQLQSDSPFEGMFGSTYHRIGLYWESETLPDGSAGATRGVNAMAEANHTVLAFDRNGFLPIGPLVGSSRLIYNQNSYSDVTFYLEGSLYEGNERLAGSPIRNNLSVDYYNNSGSGNRYFNLLPFGQSFSEKTVGESFDFLTQDHWLDNPSFSFNSDDDLSEEDLGLYTWVSRDYVYPTSSSNSDSSYLGLICTFSANKRERSSFVRPLMSPSHKGYEDMVVSITSEYFSRSLYSPSVVEIGDEFFIDSTTSKNRTLDLSDGPLPVSWDNRQLAKAKVLDKSESTDGIYQYQAVLTSINGQYGGYSESLYWQPIFTHHTGNTLFHAEYEEISGSNLRTVSLVGGNSFYWTQGNLRSLLRTSAIPTQLNSGDEYENRDTAAVDGGFGGFSSDTISYQSASLISGGRVGLLSGLPQNYAGISFASVSGGVATSSSRGGQDIGNYNTDAHRVFETFLDHGVFSYVSLPTGTGGSTSSTIGQLSREMDKRSDYKSATFGGSSGLRVSGDIQLFIRNLRILGSDDNTAFVMHTDFAPPTSTDYLISNVEQILDVTTPFLPYNETGTGPTTSALQAQKSASGFNTYDLKSQGGAHTPSGIGLFGPPNPNTLSTITDASVRRTATISLGLTLADLKGISNSLGKDLANPVGSDERQVTANFEGQYGTEADIGKTLFHMAQFASSDLATMALPVLKGAYVALNQYKNTPSGTDVNHVDNWGIYKIIDTPVLMPVDASDLESGQGSRNTLHGYGSNYSAHTRSSLNTIVANIMVRVESDEVRSIYPDSSAPDQGGFSLTPTGMLHGTTYHESNLLKKPTAKLGHSWRILKRSANNSFQDVFIFDVVDQGGNPTSAPADLHGLEINPKALGKESLSAEIVPLAYTSYGYENSDTPSEIEFSKKNLDGGESIKNFNIGVRLLGVHRNMNHRGKTTSLAFVTSRYSYDQPDSEGYVPTTFESGFEGTPYYESPSLRDRIGDFIGDSPARLVVYSSERSDRLDEAFTSKTKRLFENGESGYVSLGYPERFGLGVVLDGGLGVVSGNAVRVHPQKGNFDSLGSLSLYSSPMMDSRLDLRDGNAVSLPSRLNRTEFYGDVVVAGHDSDLVIDDARTVDGAVARMFEAQVSAGTTKNYQSRLMRFRENISPHGERTFLSNSILDDVREVLAEGGLPNVYGSSNTLPSSFLNVPPPPLPNDTVLPWTNAGIRVKTGGSVVYERPFRPQDATGADVVASMAKGAKSDRGLRGLEIPAYGECLLLPKGPPTLGGRVFEDKNTGTKIRTGLTATDLPLYEFYNGPQAFGYGGDFSVTIGNVFQEHGLYGRDGISEGAVLNSISESKASYEYSEDGLGVLSEFNPGIISQAYKHSRSNQGDWGKGRRRVFMFVSYNIDSEAENESFAVFYFHKGVRQYVELTLNPASWGYVQNLNLLNVDKVEGASALEASADPFNRNRPYFKASLSNNYNRNILQSKIDTSLDNDAFDGFYYDAYFYIPTEVDNLYIETERNSEDYSAPDIAVYFSEHDKHIKSTFIALGNSNLPADGGEGYLDLFFSAVPQGVDNQYVVSSGTTSYAWVHKFVLTNSPSTYGYYPDQSFSDLASDPHSSDASVDERNDGTNWFDPATSVAYPSLISDGLISLEQSDIYSTGRIGQAWANGGAQSDIPLQIRLLDGMVVEDVTTGTFYSVGEIGRYRGWQAHMKPLGQVGDYSNVQHPDIETYSDISALADVAITSATRALRRTMNNGNTVAINGWSTPEIIYDLNSHFDYEVNPSDPDERDNGFGDVVDGGSVRRPLVGHKFRVVPNVEFVPVLGHRSVKGGLAVPYDKSTDYTTYISEADAILYDANYHFSDSDVGRKIYICGTYEYAYVGWYVIIGIQKDYVINPYAHASITEDLFDVAVVRKIRRSGAYERTWEGENGLALPMRPRKPILEASLDQDSNGRSIYFDEYGNPKNYDFHIFDPFTPHGTEHSFVLRDFASLIDTGNLSQSTSLPTTGIWLGLQANATPNSSPNIKFFGVGASSTALNEAPRGTYFLVQALNNDPNFNGVRFGFTFKSLNLNNSGLSFEGWDTYDGTTPWIKWELKYAYQDKSSALPVPYDNYGILPVGEGYIICGITCSIQTHLLTEAQKRAVVGRGCFLQADLLFNDQLKSPYSGADFDDLSDLTDPINFQNTGRGFYYFKGHSTNVDLTWADKNSYFPNQYVANSGNITQAGNVVNNYTKWTNTTPETTLVEDTDVQIGFGYTRTSQSASGGIRWVFSAPLLEENVGSYVHLTKQRPYRFGQPTYTQLQRQGTLGVLTNPYGWASGYQRKKDLDSAQGNERIDLSTDIFRINRCPSTGDILLGGDCESYAVEDIVCRVKGGYSQRGIEIAYAPLSIAGNWPDSETNELPDTGALNYPVLYALQPVARERIVTINPTTATSSVLMAHGQYGTAPMVLPASPLALDTPNALKGGVGLSYEYDSLNPVTSAFITYDMEEVVNALQQLGSPAVNGNTFKEGFVAFNALNGINNFLNNLGLNEVSIDSSYGGADFVWGERLMMDVSRPWLLMGRESASQTHRFGDLNPFSPEDSANFNSNKVNPRTGNERYNINADFVHTDQSTEVVPGQSLGDQDGNGLGDLDIDGTNNQVESSEYTRKVRARKPEAEWDNPLLNSLPPLFQVDGAEEGGKYHQVDDHPAIEGGNAETLAIGTDRYARHKQSSGVRQAIYTWTPAGEWWQIQTPVYHGFKSAFVNESTPPPTLKIDLTEAFTQSVSQGSGLNSPYIGRTPRGARLNRIWVNFGVDGDMSVIPGSPFSDDAKEFSRNGDSNTTISDLELGGIRKSRWGNGSEAHVPYNQIRKSNSSITFNLVVEIPGSVAVHEDHFYMNDSFPTAESLDDPYFSTDPISLTDFPPAGGSNGSFMGGRLPTGAYNHSKNSERYVDSTNDGSRPRKTFTGGTVVVPLYVNREAGDLMPNVMERFVTVGPTRNKTVSPDAKSDWLLGDGKYGLGSIGNETTTPHNANTLGSTNSDINNRNTVAHLSVNAHNPVIWGGQNFYYNEPISDPQITSLGEDPRVYGDYEQNLEMAGEIQTFDDIRSASVLASSMPRSSRVGGGVTSSFSSGLYSDTSLFTPEYTNMEMALHAPATTGITVAHAGGVRTETYRYYRDEVSNLLTAFPNHTQDNVGNVITTNYSGPYDFLITQSEIESGAFGKMKYDPYKYNTGDPQNFRNTKKDPTRQSTKTSSQSFTLALTPVGDAFEAPAYEDITMPKISGGNNVEAKNLYKTISTASNEDYWDLGRYGRTLQTSTGTDPKDRRFKVGNWLDNILEYYGIPAQSGSMLPPGARVFLEVTVPWARRPQKSDQGELLYQSSNNGAWVSSVKCAFEVETADGTAWTLDVNTMGED